MKSLMRVLASVILLFAVVDCKTNGGKKTTAQETPSDNMMDQTPLSGDPGKDIVDAANTYSQSPDCTSNPNDPLCQASGVIAQTDPATLTDTLNQTQSETQQISDSIIPNGGTGGSGSSSFSKTQGLGVGLLVVSVLGAAWGANGIRVFNKNQKDLLKVKDSGDILAVQIRDSLLQAGTNVNLRNVQRYYGTMELSQKEFNGLSVDEKIAVLEYNNAEILAKLATGSTDLETYLATRSGLMLEYKKLAQSAKPEDMEALKRFMSTDLVGMGYIESSKNPSEDFRSNYGRDYLEIRTALKAAGIDEAAMDFTQKAITADPQVVKGDFGEFLDIAELRMQGQAFLDKAPEVANLQKQQKNLAKSIESLSSKTGKIINNTKTGKGVLGSLVVGIVVGGVAASGYNPFSSSSSSSSTTSSSGVQLAEGTGGSSATASFLNTLGRIMQTEIKK